MADMITDIDYSTHVLPTAAQRALVSQLLDLELAVVEAFGSNSPTFAALLQAEAVLHGEIDMRNNPPRAPFGQEN